MKPEKRLQLDIVEWLKEYHPDIIFFNDLSSGMVLSISQAVMNKRLQLTDGMPDMYIFEPRGGYHGLVLELKAIGGFGVLKDGSLSKTNKHIQQQRIVLTVFRKKGYLAEFSVGIQKSKEIIKKYLELEKDPSA